MLAQVDTNQGMAIVIRPDLALFSHQRVKVLLPQSRFSEAIVSGRIEFKAFDAIIEPPIPNCDIYFVSDISVHFQLTHQVYQLKNVMWITSESL